MALLSKHLTYEAAIASATAKKYGIRNNPSAVELANLIEWGKNIYDPIVAQFGLAFLSSGYRSKLLNSHPSIGGAKTSSHVWGEAGDIDGDAPSKNFKKFANVDLFEFALNNLEFDQLIAEFEQNGQPKWIHIGFRKNNRQQALLAIKNSKGQIYYAPYTKSLFTKLYHSNKRSAGKSNFDKIIPSQDDINTFRAEYADLDFEVTKNRKLILPSKEHNSIILDEFVDM